MLIILPLFSDPRQLRTETQTNLRRTARTESLTWRFLVKRSARNFPVSAPSARAPERRGALRDGMCLGDRATLFQSGNYAWDRFLNQ